jgi:hypothetical protein
MSLQSKAATLSSFLFFCGKYSIFIGCFVDITQIKRKKKLKIELMNKYYLLITLISMIIGGDRLGAPVGGGGGINYMDLLSPNPS